MDSEIDGSAAGRGEGRSAHGAAVSQIRRKAQRGYHGPDGGIDMARTPPDPIWRGGFGEGGWCSVRRSV
jgi:hypothetical protein